MTYDTKWLTLTAWVIILFGALICLGGFAATLLPVDILYQVFHPSDGQAVWSEHMRFSTGLLGAVTFGWGLTLLSIVKATPELKREIARSLWTSITCGLGVWYVVDSTISVANGYRVNAVSNTIIMALYMFAIRQSGIYTTKRVNG